jgi:integrase
LLLFFEKNIGEKKMQLNYLPAQYFQAKISYVQYFVLSPTSKKLVAKRIKLNRIKSVRERKKYANKLIKEINEKLAEGWNPFLESDAPKAFHKLDSVMDTFLNVKTKELRPDSIRSYKSFITQFKTYLKSKSKKEYNCVDITNEMAVNFLNNKYVKDKCGETAYNNLRNIGRLMFNWMIENNYCKVNVFEGIKTKKVQEKTRVPISPYFRKKIKDYLIKKKEYEFLSVCLLTYYGFLRPKEIGQLKVDMFDMRNQIINLPAYVTKNRKARTITIPDSLMECLLEIKLETIHPELYIFSTNFKPGKVLKDSRYTGKRWTKLRKEINLPKEIQFYSLKDTGIIQMLRDGVSPEVVRDQAGHSSLEETNKYVKIARAIANPQIKAKSGDF